MTSPSLLEQLIDAPRLVEQDRVELAAPPEQVWQLLRHGDLARSSLIRALFALRTLPDRMRGKSSGCGSIRIDDLVSTPERPGFRVLLESPGRELAVGAIGRAWELEIPFVHVSSPEEFLRFDTQGFVKVAWSVRVSARGQLCSEIELEVRVDATSEEAWRKFERYWALIGPASHFIRRTLLASLARELGTPESRQNEGSLPGDELVPDAAVQVTDSIVIRSPAERIWPWLLQMGCGRAGFYSIDALDNGGSRSARELHPEWQKLSVGQVLAATPGSEDGFEVLRVDAPRALVLGGLYDPARQRQLPFGSSRPKQFWQTSWAFVLDPLDERTTRLLVRARAAFDETERLHATWIRPVHHLMQTAQLEHLRRRAEGTLARDDLWDVLDGLGGAARILAALVAPFGRRQRSHWGLDETTAARALPGDEAVAHPRWSWTHGIEIEAPASGVWPWVAQIGAERAGFYSYQWLENLAGCEIRNAEIVHREWEVKVGDPLILHGDPSAPRLTVTEVERGRHFVACSSFGDGARATGKPWAEASWLFLVEPLADRRCRVISRFRCACSEDLATRLSFGPTVVEPVAFAMDRRMLLGIKERAER